MKKAVPRDGFFVASLAIRTQCSFRRGSVLRLR